MDLIQFTKIKDRLNEFITNGSIRQINSQSRHAALLYIYHRNASPPKELLFPGCEKQITNLGDTILSLSIQKSLQIEAWMYFGFVGGVRDI